MWYCTFIYLIWSRRWAGKHLNHVLCCLSTKLHSSKSTCCCLYNAIFNIEEKSLLNQNIKAIFLLFTIVEKTPWECPQQRFKFSMVIVYKWFKLFTVFLSHSSYDIYNIQKNHFNKIWDHVIIYRSLEKFIYVHATRTRRKRIWPFSEKVKQGRFLRIFLYFFISLTAIFIYEESCFCSFYCRFVRMRARPKGTWWCTLLNILRVPAYELTYTYFLRYDSIWYWNVK